MITAIERIIIKERIRKDITKISELAEDIRINGLLNPVTVMEVVGGRYQLLAGLRRIKAVQSIGLTEIDVNIVLPADAEAALRIEISENEQREPFTFSEKMDFARLIEDIERAKANERRKSGVKLSESDLTVLGAEGRKRETRSIVGAKIGISGKQYDRAKYVAENAPLEVIDQLDKGERSIRGTYDELRAKEKAAEKAALPDDFAEPDDGLPEEEPVSEPAPRKKEFAKSKPSAPKCSDSVPEEEMLKLFSKKDIEAMRKINEFEALPPEGKIAELQRQLFDMRVRANAAEAELDRLKYEYGIKVDHKDSIIESLKRQVAELSEALEAANARTAKLE